ncbi:MAG: YfhO family protein [Prevotellaceae bacterium]|nr:YfhO family protein [Prevotella sp.]MDD7529499.1 YfhO family protein [Prevotellaceae bacterium]
MRTWKQWLPDVLAVILFAVLAFAYFFPADMEGRILYQHDVSAGRGAGHEAAEYKARTGEQTRWTNAIFGGMPTYQTSPSYNSTSTLNQAINAYHLWFPDNVWYVFVYLLGFYIMLRCFNFRQSLAVLGSIVWAFSSYFFIIIAAGHIWKVMALAYLPPLIGGVVLAYRGKLLWGFVLTALFSAFEVHANHVQMTYYYLFLILFMVIAFLVDAVRKHELTGFFKATAVCAVAAVIGIGVNISNLYHTWEYQKETMRGKSELVKAADKDAANQTSSGLDRDYITQWSYGIGETWTLLVPNTKGGASVPMNQNETAMKKAEPMYYDIYSQIGQYWGEQPMTSGPVYVGAFVLMLFIFGLFVVKGPMKWALLTATVFSILLAWGHNFMSLTNLFIDYMPMYAKFRAVASILVIAEFTIPLLAVMALKRIVEEPNFLNRHSKQLYISFGLTAGMALLFALMPTVFFPDYISSAERQALSQIPSEQLGGLLANITEMRKAIFVADCWRTVFVIVAGMVLLILLKKNKLKSSYTVAAIAVLCLADMWMVNKRYLNDGMFVNKSVREMPVEMTETDAMILKDKSLNYRVLNFASNTFNENETSFYHKSIGGYHAAKLRRYQEMIDHHIIPEMQRLMKAVVRANGQLETVNGDSLFPVINMLNTKYFIMPVKDGRTMPVTNPYAMGNAWFVDHVAYAANANEEIDAVGKIDLRRQAIADKQFEDILGQSVKQDSTSRITMSEYEPNKLSYVTESGKGGVVVFSDIYYPGWTATIDGKDIPVGRVNYILRAVNVPSGKHKVVLSFFPKTIDRTETIAYVSFALLVLSFIFALLKAYLKYQKEH